MSIGIEIVAGFVVGLLGWFVVRYVLGGFYTVDQNERAVKTIFGRADRIEGSTTLSDPISGTLKGDETDRYEYPQMRVIMPGGPYFKWPWEQIYKVPVSTNTLNMAYDPMMLSANDSGTRLEAVTKDQLNTGLTGQIRYRVSERNLYAFIFGIKNPIAHVMGFFVSVLRERIANFEAPPSDDPAMAKVGAGISINDLRKNLRSLNDLMVEECKCAEARYGVVLDASLITGIDPPTEVESALAAINTAHNMVSSDISLAQAGADQRIEQSKRAVEIETLKAYAEVEPLTRLANQLSDLKAQGPKGIPAYVRNVKLALFNKAQQVIVEADK